jgi:hypothetical protein
MANRAMCTTRREAAREADWPNEIGCEPWDLVGSGREERDSPRKRAVARSGSQRVAETRYRARTSMNAAPKSRQTAATIGAARVVIRAARGHAGPS